MVQLELSCCTVHNHILSQMFAVFPTLPIHVTKTPQHPPSPMNIDNNEDGNRLVHADRSSVAAAATAKESSTKAVRFAAQYDPLKNNKKSFDPILKAAMSLSAADIREHNLRRRQQRKAEIELFLRVKALLGIFEKRDPKLRQQVLLAVRLCNRKLSDGRISRLDLNDKIESSLRLMVGENNWRMACDVQRRIERQERKSIAKTSADQDKKVNASSRAA